MKHITEKWGHPFNEIECTVEEREILTAFLSKIGIEVRTPIRYANTCIIEARNPYMEWAHLSKDHGGKRIVERAESEIESGHWRR